MYLLLNALWFAWVVKFVLFWLYLWQLKDYHIPRFIDHFRTHKGKKLILNPIQITKIALLALFLIANQLFNYLFIILIIIYCGEFLIFAINIFKKLVKKPVKTSKTIFLTSVSFIVVILFLFFVLKFNESAQPVLLLGFDILTPVIISVVVLVFQPFFVLLRNKKLKMAQEKINKIKSVSGLKVIAITGSYGKTTTKEFLTTILSKKFRVLSTKEHQNAEIGIAKCILNDLKPSHQIFIAEVGAYDKGKVKEVCNMIKPKIGLVTGVNEQHLALFGSLENLLSAEGGRELAIALREKGLLIVNGDNKYCLNLYKGFEGSKKVYSLNNKLINPDIWAEDIDMEKDYISFMAINKNKEMNYFRANVLGKQNVQNLLGAILVAKELGMNFDEISEACKGIVQSHAGMTLKEGKYNINIIDSSYSSNPDGVFADLDYFYIFKGKRVLVMPCLIELGEKSTEIHEKIGRKISEVCDLAIITSKDQFRALQKGFNESESKRMGSKLLLCENTQDIYSMITLFCKAGDSVLLEGRVPAGLIKLLV